MKNKLIIITSVVIGLAMLLAYTTPNAKLKKAKVGRPERHKGEGLFLAKLAKDKMGHKQALAFCNGVEEISCEIEAPSEWLMSIIHHESRFVPSAKNPKSTGSGLLQMLNAVAKSHGTTSASLREMSAIQQLPYIRKYFIKDVSMYGKYISVTDMYLAVFAPSKRPKLREIYKKGGDLSSLIIYRAGSDEYVQNAGVDPTPGDAGLTYADLSRHIMDMYPEVLEYKSIPCQE